MTDFDTYLAGEDGGVLVLKLSGRLDNHSASQLESCLEQYLGGGTTKLVLDCSALQHISSLGLGALVRLHSRLQNKGGQVKLAGVDNGIADILQIVHFEKLFHAYPTVEAACESFKILRDETA